MNKVAKNYFYNLIYRILTLILPFITTPYISRVLNPEGIGAYNYTLSVVNVFILIASLGTAMYAQREIAFCGSDRTERNKVFSEILLIRIITSVLISVVYIVMSFKSEKYMYLFMAQYICIVANMIDISWLFQGVEDFKKTATRGIVIKLLSVLAIFLFVRTKDDVVIYTLICATFTLFNALVLWFFASRIVDFQIPSWKRAKKHLRPVFLLFLPVAATYVYTYIDKIVLGMLSTESEVGFYSQSENMVKLAMTVITSLGTVLLPRISKLIGNNEKEEVRNEVMRAIKFVVTWGLPMTVGLALIASIFVPWFLGENYAPCILLIEVLSVLIVIIGLSSVTGQAVLVPMKKQNIYTLSIVAGAIANIIANFCLIPRYGALGAAIGTIIAELIVNFIQQVVVYKIISINIVDVLNNNKKNIFATIIMAVTLHVIKSQFTASVIGTILFAAIGVAVYIAFLLLFKDDSVNFALDAMKNRYIRRRK